MMYQKSKCRLLKLAISRSNSSCHNKDNYVYPRNPCYCCLFFIVYSAKCLSETIYLPSQGRGKVCDSAYALPSPNPTCKITLSLLLLYLVFKLVYSMFLCIFLFPSLTYSPRNNVFLSL